jgi:hypothetical protein
MALPACDLRVNTQLYGARHGMQWRSIKIKLNDTTHAVIYLTLDRALFIDGRAIRRLRQQKSAAAQESSI